MMADNADAPIAVIARRVHELRMELGLNQTEFAQALGVSRRHVSDIENGGAKITVDLLFDVESRLLNKSKKASVLWLITGRLDPVPWGDYPERSQLNAVMGLDGRGLVAAFRTLDVIMGSAPQAISAEMKADLLKRTLYIYISELERARQRGAEPEDARRFAEEACDNALRDFGVAAVAAQGDAA
jgi:transcriptional regulator with XRE-family HTH domain